MVSRHCTRRSIIFFIFVLVCISATSVFADDAFLHELSNDTYAFLLAMEAKEGNGVPENWYRYPDTGSYTSPEETGFYMLSHIGAYEMGLINKSTAKERIEKTMDVLLYNWSTYQHASQETGLYFRYYNTRTLEVDSFEVSSIGNAMLLASLLVIDAWASEQNDTSLSDDALYLANRMNLGVFYNDTRSLFAHNAQKLYYWDYYSDEGRLLSFIAHALGQI